MNIFKYIKKLFDCKHDWKNLWETQDLAEKSARLCGTNHTYKCSKCGKYKEEYIPYNRN